MQATTRNLHQGKVKPRQLEALAFYLGAHGVDPAPVQDEIEARFVQETSEEKRVEHEREEGKAGHHDGLEIGRRRVAEFLADASP